MPNYMTRTTHDRLRAARDNCRAELQRRGTIVRQAIDSGGGMHDNAMYDSAVQDQRVLASRLAHLEGLLADVQYLEDLRTAADVITIGKTVLLHYEDEPAPGEITILGAADAEFMVERSDVISVHSPLAQQLLGARASDNVTLALPGRERTATILKIGRAVL